MKTQRRTMGRVLLGAAIGLLLLCGSARAQYFYTWALGGRFGSPLFGASIKGFLNDRSALEGITSFGSFGIGITGLYEYHLYLPGVPGLRPFLGGGAHVATGRASAYNPYADSQFSDIYAGLDGVTGVEYVFEDIPLALSIDVLPVLNFPGRIGLWWNAGVSVRYMFK